VVGSLALRVGLATVAYAALLAVFGVGPGLVVALLAVAVTVAGAEALRVRFERLVGRVGGPGWLPTLAQWRVYLSKTTHFRALAGTNLVLLRPG
jgi:hypothetical protein